MAELEEQLKIALTELRKEKERKFNQTIDLIINLRKFDPKRNSVNIFAQLPHKIKEKKICAFLESKNKNVETITRDDFKKYSSKGQLKKLVKNYDFFIAQASLMPQVATSFGRVLGPAGKMPSPQLGIIVDTDEKTIKDLKDKINSSIRIRTKESSIKIPAGKQDMEDKDIIENISAVYNAVLKSMPRDKENIKNIEIKFTMSKPQKIKLK